MPVLNADLFSAVTPSVFVSSGRGGFLWPGLNAPVLKDGSLQSMSRRGETEQQEVQAELGICSLTAHCNQSWQKHTG